MKLFPRRKEGWRKVLSIEDVLWGRGCLGEGDTVVPEGGSKNAGSMPKNIVKWKKQNLLIQFSAAVQMKVF